MRVMPALLCTALIAVAASAQTVPVADIPVTVDNIPYAPPETIQYDGFKTLFARGTEWAATGKVTIRPHDKAAGFSGD
ncbi:MAG: hypothetical protein ACK4GG_05610 [Sphingomonas sp.]